MCRRRAGRGEAVPLAQARVVDITTSLPQEPHFRRSLQTRSPNSHSFLFLSFRSRNRVIAARSDPHSCQLRALRLVLHAADSAWERANLATDMGGCVSKQSKSSAGEAPPPASPPVAGDTSAQLLAAATSGDVAAVRAALDGGANCNCADEVRGARWPRPVLRTLCRVSVRRAAPPASRARRRLRQRAARAAGRAAPAAYG